MGALQDLQVHTAEVTVREARYLFLEEDRVDNPCQNIFQGPCSVQKQASSSHPFCALPPSHSDLDLTAGATSWHPHLCVFMSVCPLCAMLFALVSQQAPED